MNRREFLTAVGGVVAAASVRPVSAASGPATGKPSGKLIVSSPVLQNAAETSMGVGFAVSDLANGFVEISASPDMAGARKVMCGGYRVTDMNDRVMLVRLTGLKPNTRYYYRIGADRIAYKHQSDVKILGTETDPRIYSFVTIGAGGGGRFCVINDTHMQMKSFGMAIDKVAELHPDCVVWNGDACTTNETMDSLIPVFYTPGIARRDYAAETPYIYNPGNHDYRGLATRHLERVWMYRQPEERAARDWDLGRNFAVRCGDVALVGLDSGEDKPDDVPSFAGLFNFESYRAAQAVWLKDALARPDIRSAPYLVAFCHIPLYDPNPKRRRDWAKLWMPLLAEAGCQLVVTAHQHGYRYDAPDVGRTWAQIVGGESGAWAAARQAGRLPIPDGGRRDRREGQARDTGSRRPFGTGGRDVRLRASETDLTVLHQKGDKR